ncbi:hypothetical protein, partial [Salinispira pacifica]
SAGLFIDPEGEEAFDSFYREFCDADESFEEMALRAKYRIMTNSLASELNVLANRFNRLAKQSRRTRDFSRIGFRNAIADVVARFPVYRSYVDSHGATDEDRRDIDWAVAQAKKQAAIPDTSIYDFIHDVLTIDLASARQGGRGRREFRRRDVIDLAMRFQQFTGPVTAKSVEDTAFYRYVRFVARNEVGGDPARYYVSPQAFHLENRYRASTLPFGMISTATHDHKRGEDVRMRLAALSEVPEQWRAFVSRMGELSGFFKSEIDGETAPSAADEYLFYQTVVGSWPLDLTGPEYPGLEDYAQRLAAYMLKAAREAKVMTGWTATNEPYEAALTRFVESVLSVRRGRILLREIESFVERVASAGALYSLSQLLLRLTVPGVPDTYQGCDLWDFSLVDPDNRRPVDFVQRRRLREDRAGLARTAVAEELGSHWRDGAIKQYILESVLSFRAERPDLFAAGTYDSLECVGERERSVLAFVRELDGAMLVVAVPRLCSELIDDRGTLKLRGFGDTTVRMPEWSPAAGEERERRLFRSLLDTAQLPLNSGETVAIDALMTGFPLVALYSDPPSGAG